MAESTVDRNAFSQLAAYLDSIGLGSLFSFTNNEPSGWLWEQVKQGLVTKDQLQMALEATPEFKQRFAIIFELRDQANKSGGGYVPTVDQVLEYEQSYMRTMMAAGLPSWFYDSLDDAHNAMRTGLSVTQISDRIQYGYTRVRELPPEARQVFAEYYGQDAESALLAAVLDPQKTLAEIDRAARTAEAGGMARRFGVTADQRSIERYAQLGKSSAEVRSDLQAAADLQPLTTAQMGETQGGISQISAFEAAAMGDAQQKALLEGRLTTRKLGQASPGGGALAGNSGIAGAGVV